MTLGREVELFWKGKCRGAAILFYINRYLNLLFSIYELVCIAYIPAQVREARHTFIYRNLTLQHRVTRGTSTGLCCRVRPW